MIDVEGQKFRVLLGTCPEEVEQWRAARKKLWPTKANIARFVGPRQTTESMHLQHFVQAVAARLCSSFTRGFSCGRS